MYMYVGKYLYMAHDLKRYQNTTWCIRYFIVNNRRAPIKDDCDIVSFIFAILVPRIQIDPKPLANNDEKVKKISI